MTTTPKVTVVTTIYNPGRYLEPMVQSVVGQTFTDWQLIIVDDESPEDAGFIVDRHPNISMIRRKNGGAYAARNTGILHTTGEYLAFIDQDDLWAPTKLERQVALMDASPDVGLCHTRTDVVDGEGSYVEPGFARNVDSYEDLLTGNCIMNCSSMVRRSILASAGLFDGYYYGVGDYDLWLRIARKAKLAFIPTCEAFWRSHDGNYSGKADVMYRELDHLYRSHIGMAREEGNKKAVAAARQGLRSLRISYGCIYFAGARDRLNMGHRKEFYKLYLLALKLYPSFVLKSTLTYLLARSVRRAAPALENRLPGR